MAAGERVPPEEEEEEKEEEEEPEEEEEAGEEESTQPPPSEVGCPPKRVVPGVLYLSFLPPGFGPRHARALLGTHGELGRIFLQPRGGRVRKRRQRPGPSAGSFVEGWVEFRDKRAAKRAAALLHGTPMTPRPRSPFRHHCWSLKYLPGFRWPHLSERLSYERQVRAQRLRAEVAQAKREGGFFAARRDPPPAPRGDAAPPPAGRDPPAQPPPPALRPTSHRGRDLGTQKAAPPERAPPAVAGEGFWGWGGVRPPPPNFPFFSLKLLLH